MPFGASEGSHLNYCIAEFAFIEPILNPLQIVPSRWIRQTNRGKVCPYPADPESFGFDQIVEELGNYDEDWPVFDVKIKGRVDTYGKAQNFHRELNIRTQIAAIPNIENHYSPAGRLTAAARMARTLVRGPRNDMEEEYQVAMIKTVTSLATSGTLAVVEGTSEPTESELVEMITRIPRYLDDFDESLLTEENLSEKYNFGNTTAEELDQLGERATGVLRARILAIEYRL